MLTAALGLAALGALVYAVGVDESREAAARTGGGLKRAATSSAAAGAAGAGIGLQFGGDLVNALVTEPGFALAAVTGILGSLGTGGFLEPISGVQFAFLGFVAFAGVWVVFGGGD